MIRLAKIRGRRACRWRRSEREVIDVDVGFELRGIEVGFGKEEIISFNILRHIMIFSNNHP